MDFLRRIIAYNWRDRKRIQFKDTGHCATALRVDMYKNYIYIYNTLQVLFNGRVNEKFACNLSNNTQEYKT